MINDARTDTLLSVQVNVPAESGEMGILAQHVPSIEQLRPGLIEIIEESGGSKQFFCKKEHQEHGITANRLSVRRIRYRAAKLGSQHQRCRGFRLGGIQYGSSQLADIRGTKDRKWWRQRGGYC